MIIFYTTHCPRCRVLKAKLDEKHVAYTECDNMEEMMALGMKSAPALSVDGELMDFSDAVKWVRGVEVSNG
jgi:glutaredoxin